MAITSYSVVQTQGIFTRQTAMQAVGSDNWCTDPYFEQTTLLLQADGVPDGGNNNTFVDSSDNNFTVTRIGATMQGAFSPYSQPDGHWGNFFDGTADFLLFGSNAAFALPGDFTYECWIQPNNLSGARGIFGIGTTDPDSNLIRISGSKLQFWLGGSNAGGPGSGTKTGIITCATTIVVDRWYHVALVRNGTSTNNVKLYLNGVLDGQGTATYDIATKPCIVGGSYPGSTSETFYGYISNARLVKGAALYTTNFSPSTIPLTNTTAAGTVSLLTCQSNRFIDNSSNAFAITLNGTPIVRLVSPFAPGRAYTPEAVGGSGYFDGAADYLSLLSSANLAPGSVFTFEAWIYAPSLVSGATIYSAVLSGELQIGQQGTTSWGVAARGTGWRLVSTTMPTPNQWNHIVVSRGGVGTNQTSLFLNGVRVANGTVSDAFTTTAAYQIGYDGGAGGARWNGYISSLRLVKGVDVYGYTNATITIPTAPVPKVSGTQLLAKFDNAEIVDVTNKNNGNTVGDAQIRTDEFKYGSGSFSFDGIGDYLIFPSSHNFALPGDFTIEFWMHPLSVAVEPAIFSIGTIDPSTSLVRMSGAKLQFWINGSTSGIITCATTIVINTWYHVAWVRSGVASDNVKLYLNGVQDGVTTTAKNAPISGPALVARYGSTQDSGAFNGYIDDLRVTKDVARYTANFTPPQIGFRKQ